MASGATATTSHARAPRSRSSAKVAAPAKYAQPAIPTSGTPKIPGSVQRHSPARTATGSISEASASTIAAVTTATRSAGASPSPLRRHTARATTAAESTTTGQTSTTTSGTRSSRTLHVAAYP